MRGNPFISRNSAFLFAGMTIFGAMIMVGGDDTDGVAEQTAEQVTAQRGALERNIADLGSPPPAAPQDIDIETEPEELDLNMDPGGEVDDFLIDDTEGFDPSPANDTFAPMLETEPEPITPDEAALPVEE